MPINSRVDGHTIQYYIATKMKQSATKHSKMSHNVEKRGQCCGARILFRSYNFPKLAKPTYGVSFSGNDYSGRWGDDVKSTSKDHDPIA